MANIWLLTIWMAINGLTNVSCVLWFFYQTTCLLDFIVHIFIYLYLYVFSPLLSHSFQFILALTNSISKTFCLSSLSFPSLLSETVFVLFLSLAHTLPLFVFSSKSNLSGLNYNSNSNSTPWGSWHLSTSYFLSMTETKYLTSAFGFPSTCNYPLNCFWQ